MPSNLQRKKVKPSPLITEAMLISFVGSHGLLVTFGVWFGAFVFSAGYILDDMYDEGAFL